MHLRLGCFVCSDLFLGCDAEEHIHVITNRKMCTVCALCMYIYIGVCVILWSTCVYLNMCLFVCFLHFCRYMSRTDFWESAAVFPPRWWRGSRDACHQRWNVHVGMEVEKVWLFWCWLFICLERFFVTHFDTTFSNGWGKHSTSLWNSEIASWNLWAKILCMIGHHQKTSQKLSLLQLSISYPTQTCKLWTFKLKKLCTIYTVKIKKARYQQWMVWKTYCWWKKSCTTWHVWILVNSGLFTISTGAGFFPPTVSPFKSWWFCASTLPETNSKPPWKSMIARWVSFWGPAYVQGILLMEEIPNNHLECINPCKSWDILHINWWTPDFWSINSMLVSGRVDVRFGRVYIYIYILSLDRHEKSGTWNLCGRDLAGMIISSLTGTGIKPMTDPRDRYIYLHDIRLICMVNAGKYAIHGSYGQ